MTALDSIEQRHTKITATQVILLSVFLFIFALYIFDMAGMGPTPVRSSFSRAIHNYTYSELVKHSIRNIKQMLEFRPPLGVLPFVRMMGHYIAAPNYNLSNCVIGKSMCTQMNGILCYLWQYEGFVANNRSIETENWEHNYCDKRNSFDTWRMLQDTVPQPLNTTVIVRDPIQRFVSAFINKCVHEEVACYGCMKNVTCIVEKSFEEVVQFSKDHPNLSVRRDIPVDISYEGMHFAPLTWNCDLWDRSEEYLFIKYGEDSTSFNITRLEVLKFLENQNVEADKLKVIDYALNFRSYHATKTTYSKLREETLEILLKSRKHLEMMTHMYYYDYLAFGFKPPIEIYYPSHWRHYFK